MACQFINIYKTTMQIGKSAFMQVLGMAGGGKRMVRMSCQPTSTGVMHNTTIGSEQAYARVTLKKNLQIKNI